MTCSAQHSVAAYTLGTLEDSDRELMAAHLQGCPVCQETCREFAALPGLLARVNPADVIDPPRPTEYAFRRLAAVATARRRGRRHRWVAAAAAAVLLAVGTGAAVAWWPGPENSASTIVAAKSGSVDARVTVVTAAAGSRLTLQLSGVPPEQRCRLVAVSADGHREIAGSWEATYTGTATISGNTGIPADALAAVIVETWNGRELVRIDIHT